MVFDVGEGVEFCLLGHREQDHGSINKISRGPHSTENFIGQLPSTLASANASVEEAQSSHHRSFHDALESLLMKIRPSGQVCPGQHTFLQHHGCSSLRKEQNPKRLTSLES